MQRRTPVAGKHIRVSAQLKQRGDSIRMLASNGVMQRRAEAILLVQICARRFLPAHQKTAVEFTPKKPGIFEFTCGMSMLRGKIVVEEGKK